MASDRRISGPVRRLIPMLLHFSTIIAALAGGLALIVAARRFGPQARLATGLCVGGLYLLRRARQSVGHARSPSRLDADGRGARADRRRLSAELFWDPRPPLRQLLGDRLGFDRYYSGSRQHLNPTGSNEAQSAQPVRDARQEVGVHSAGWLSAVAVRADQRGGIAIDLREGFEIASG